MCRDILTVFKPGAIEDASAIMAVIQGAQAHLKHQGIDQWQNNYPNIQTIKDDITHNNNYILLKEHKIVGTLALIFADDTTYHHIYEGAWITTGEYAVIHRLAISPDYHGLGLGAKLLEHASKMCQVKGINSIRVDTHRENQAMQRLLEKNGFVYCGIIYLEDGNERVAFEKVLS